MKLILYNNFSESNRVDKTISKIIELEGSLLEATSLVNPSIKIFFNPEGFNGYVVEDNTQYIVFNGLKITWDSFIYNYVLSANYAYIPLFNRYYVINDIISVRLNVWQIRLSVDVLMSYKNQIRNLYAFINRNEFIYNKYIKDDMVSYYYDKEVIEYIPEKGDKVNKTFSTEQTVISNNIVLNVINEDIEINFDDVTSPDTSLPDVSAPTTGDSMTSISYATYSTMITRLAKRLQQDDSLAGFIISLMVFPFAVDTTGSDIYLKLGDKTLTETSSGSQDEVQVAKLATQTAKYYVIADFTVSGDSFLDFEPYSQYELYLPYIGWLSISADNILNNRIIVYYVVNYATGSSQVTVYDITNKKILYTGGCQLGVKLGINTTTQREVNDNRTSNGISLGVGLLTSAVSIIAGAVTYNPVAIAGGVITAGSNVAKFVQNNNTNYLRASGSVNSGQAGLYLPQDVRIRKTVMKPRNYDDEYAKLFGKPLNEYRKLEGLQGFTTVGNIHLENIGSATNQEIIELDTLLKSGIIL